MTRGIRALPEPGATCGAKTRKGTPCAQPPMPNGRCRFHGGATPKGVASPHYRHGRYSAYMPTGLRERAEAMLGDPDLLSLRDEIGLVDALTAGTMEGIDLGGALQSAAAMAATVQALQVARQRGDTAGMAKALDALTPLADRARQAADAVNTLLDLLERRRRLVDTERRRLEAMQASITAADAYLLVDAMVQSVTEHVHDDRALAAIADDLQRILATVGTPRGARDGAAAG